MDPKTCKIKGSGKQVIYRRLNPKKGDIFTATWASLEIFVGLLHHFSKLMYERHKIDAIFRFFTNFDLGAGSSIVFSKWHNLWLCSGFPLFFV